MIDHLFQALDTNKSVEVNCDYVETFAATFAAFAELTSYDSALLVESPTVFGEAVKR